MSGIGGRQTQHVFSQYPSVSHGRSTFNRSFGRKDAFFFDILNPIYVDEVLPGDTINLSVNAFLRLAPQVVPLMDNMYMDFFFFFVPNRLVWDNWEKFMGAQDNPGDSISYTIPQMPVVASADTPGALYEKLGIPIGVGTQNVNALPFRGYNLIWNQWFRDENINASVVVDKDDGPDTLSDYVILYRNARHDYFTSCLPWPQKGTAINLLPAAAPVTSNGSAPTFSSTTTGLTNQGLFLATGSADVNTGAVNSSGGTIALKFGSTTGLELAPTAAGTINQLRQAFSVQRLLELDARGGTRYVELLLAHFGVTSPDFRLQRTEYLGGGQMRINAHPVPQTSATSGGNYQANLAAFATGSTIGDGKIGFTKSFVEHGYVIGMCAARSDLTYQHGIEKHWLRSTRYDYFWPELENIGEQAVTNKEIWADSAGGLDATVFGYQERYAEYKYKPSTVGGYFASVATGTLDSWHLARKFLSPPTLNGNFLGSSTPITRNLANSAATPILFDAYFSLKHTRPMRTYSVPGGLTRF